METGNKLPRRKQTIHTLCKKSRTRTPRKQTKEEAKKRLKHYKDEIAYEGQRRQLDEGMIKIQQTNQTQAMRKTYRDTTRKREHILKNKYRIHGNISTINHKWNNRKLEEEAETLIKEAEETISGQNGTTEGNCGMARRTTRKIHP